MKKAKKTTARKVCISGDAFNKLISLGASHHANLERLRRSAKPVRAAKTAKKSRKKTGKRSTKKRARRR